MRLRRRLALVLALVLLPVAAAQAAIPLQNPKGEPLDTKQVNAPTRFNIHIELGGSEHIKDLTQQLPRGIQPDGFYPTCAVAAWMADNCPAPSQVGTTKVELTVLVMPETVEGRIYYLEPEGGQLPGLGIILDAPTGKQFQRGETRLNPELGVLESTIRNFPQDAGGIPIRINSLDVILSERFIKNPASCETVATNFLVTSYEDPGTTSTASAPLTPTGCAPRPRPRCRVPNVLHRKLADAKAAIRRTRCRVGAVSRKDARARDQGRVIRQAPAPGKKFNPGKKVNLVVGK